MDNERDYFRGDPRAAARVYTKITCDAYADVKRPDADWRCTALEDLATAQFYAARLFDALADLLKDPTDDHH